MSIKAPSLFKTNHAGVIEMIFTVKELSLIIDSVLITTQLKLEVCNQLASLEVTEEHKMSLIGHQNDIENLRKLYDRLVYEAANDIPSASEIN
jgi:hypothetical protein